MTTSVTPLRKWNSARNAQNRGRQASLPAPNANEREVTNVQTQVHLLTSTGKPSGCVVDGWRLVRRARGSVHMLRHPPCWAFERHILEQAHEAGATLVEVHDTETGVTYSVPLSTLWQKGFRIQRGHGEQIALPLNLWHKEDPRQGRLF